jgi:hypothetical protein
VKRLLAISLLCIAACSTRSMSVPSDVALTTVGDVLDRGGTRLSSATIVGELPGTTWAAIQDLGEVTFKADGTFAGFTRHSDLLQKVRGLFGTWFVGEDGKLCLQYRSLNDNDRRTCGFVYRVEADYFLSTSSNDRSAKAVRQRQVGL